MTENLDEKSEQIVGNSGIYWPAVFVISLFVVLLIVWSCLDHNIPVWDSAGHLLKSYRSAEIIQAHTALGPKIRNLIQVSVFYTPLTYYFHALLICLLGYGAWVDVIPRIFWYALSCISLYLLAKKCFDDKAVATLSVALWCLYPGMYGLARASGLLDIPMAAMIFFSLWWALIWRERPSWLNASCLGVILGLTFLTKQTAALFLLAPMVVLIYEQARKRRWQNCLLLIFAGGLGCLFFASWFVPNFKAFREFVSENQSVLPNQPFILMFYDNLTTYIFYQAISCTPPATLLFAAATILAKHKAKFWIVSVSIISGIIFHSALNWVPQPRYILAADALMAIFSSLFLVQSWRAHKKFSRPLIVLAALYAACCFTDLSFSPPLPVIAAVENALGLTLVRTVGKRFQNVAPMWPCPEEDWGHDWIINTVDKEVRGAPVLVHNFSDTRELNAGGLDYVSKLLHKSNVQFITFRIWSMAGYDFKYTEAQLNTCKWFVVLQNSKEADGRKFVSAQAEANFNNLIKLVTSDSTYETVGTKILPDGSKLLLVRRKDWNKPTQ